MTCLVGSTPTSSASLKTDWRTDPAEDTLTFPQHKPPTAALSPAFYLVCAACITIMLIAGLSPRGPLFSNDAYSDEVQPSLQFHGHGVAYTEPFQLSNVGKSGTLIAALEPAPKPGRRGFQAIAIFDNHNPAEQLMVAQWKRQILVMTGDDYPHINKAPRLTVDLEEHGDEPLLLAVVLDDSAAGLYYNGALASSVTGGFLLPEPSDELRLILGNSADGRLPWSGRLFGIALYNRALTADEVAQFTGVWQRANRFSDLSATDAEMFYDFSQVSGNLVEDLSGHPIALQIPQHRFLLYPDFPELRLSATTTADFLVNLIGFVPFGLLLMIWMVKTNESTSLLRNVLFVIVSGLLFSTFIEISQAWIPSRSSSLLDILLNTAGTALGAGLRIAPDLLKQHTSDDA